MNVEDVTSFFQEPQPRYLCQEEALVFVTASLLVKDNYGSGLLNDLEETYSKYKLSDTVLYQALQTLIDWGWITSHQQNVVGRGRPRRMFSLDSSVRSEAETLAKFWKQNFPVTSGAIAS